MALSMKLYNSNLGLIDACSVIFPYFDKSFYRLSYGISDEADPIVHYLEIGAREGFDPSTFFSTKHYLNSNPEVDFSTENPFLHYILKGMQEYRLPQSKEYFSSCIPSLDLNDKELSLNKWMIPIIIDEASFSKNKGSEDIVLRLNGEKANAAILKRNSNDWLIVFGGHLEDFFFLNKVKSFWGNVLLLRDCTYSCYFQNPGYPAPHRLSEYLDYLTGIRRGRTILFGQSYGGYCALYQSKYLVDSLVFAFSPQVYHSGEHSYSIHFENAIPKVEPPKCAGDLVEHVKSSDSPHCYVIVGSSEAKHLSKYYWGDLVAGGLLASTGKVSLLVIENSGHAAAQYLNSEKFFSILSDNYEIFYDDRDSGAKLLSRSGVFYKSLS